MYTLDILSRDSSETARQYAFRVLHHNILYLKLKPGQLVSESELSEQLHLSRTPIREALKDLEKSHVVQVEPQKGTFVSDIDSSLVSDACFLRLTIEQAIISQVCKGISSDFLNQLEENLYISSYYISRGDTLKWYELDNSFHKLFFKACGKERIHELFDNVMIHLDRIRIMHLKEENMSIAHKEHLSLLDAIKKGDESQALKVLKQHLTYCVEHCN